MGWVICSLDLHESIDVLPEVLRLPLACSQRWVDVVGVYKKQRVQVTVAAVGEREEPTGCGGVRGQRSDHAVDDINAVCRECTAVLSRAVELDNKQGISMGKRRIGSISSLNDSSVIYQALVYSEADSGSTTYCQLR